VLSRIGGGIWTEQGRLVDGCASQGFSASCNRHINCIPIAPASTFFCGPYTLTLTVSTCGNIDVLREAQTAFATAYGFARVCLLRHFQVTIFQVMFTQQVRREIFGRQNINSSSSHRHRSTRADGPALSSPKRFSRTWRISANGESR
jgi:hypothetical protein